LNDRSDSQPSPQPRRQAPSEPLSDQQRSALDDRFAELVRQADPSAALDKATEDVRMPALLEAGLRSYIYEQGDQREQYSLDPRPGDNPSLHGRLRRTLDEETEDQVHWSFRAIAAINPRAVQNRIERLRINAGLDPDVPKRKAYLLRTGNWATGTRKTQEMLENFRTAGGVLLDEIQVDDLRTFTALEQMWRNPTPELSAWLLHRRHAGRTALFRTVFGEPGPAPEIESGPVPPAPPDDPGPPVEHTEHTEHTLWPDDDPDAVAPQATAPAHTVSLGNRADTGAAVPVSLESLRKHAAIFAGSGSGKTVLIRRLIEECALQGVSSIVLDPNNDLARLGEAWPQPPSACAWGSGDAAKATDYLTHTDVVIWTPRREAGRPLSFQPLPDLAAVADDPDEFGLALDTAIAALAPRARADGSTAKAEQARAVLREALASFARDGGAGLNAFLELLADLPDGVTTLTKARAMAEDMSQTLTAAMINDPLFGGAGAPLDPGVLLTPAPGKRARVSVISLIGLSTEQQRQSFVNQLQMALFAWIKQHPAGDRPLGGLFVMDEAQTLAPSGGMTACTASTLALASQARKYGLGLVFATQSPKGIHNRIVGNAATQYFGFINSPTQVAAAKEMAAAKGSAVLDISRLSAGQFYAVGEGMPFQKVITPMCLSHHPSSALTAEEVLTRARNGA
ncbi:MAG: ATP-binding protein, partial [Sciscionella sp.]